MRHAMRGRLGDVIEDIRLLESKAPAVLSGAMAVAMNNIGKSMLRLVNLQVCKLSSSKCLGQPTPKSSWLSLISLE